MELCDVAAERAVLAGLCQHGINSYLEVSDILGVACFTFESNQSIYKCIMHLYEKRDVQQIDIPSIWSAAADLNLKDIYDKVDERDYLRGLFNFPINQSNIKKLAGKIKKLNVIRSLKNRLIDVAEEISKFTGDERIDQILSVPENAVLQFSQGLEEHEEAGLMGEGIEEYVEYLGENQRDNVGISTGFKGWDKMLGGGLLPGVNLLGARSKVGKAQPLDAIIYTPSGPKTMGEIKVGMEVLSPSGQPVEVIGVYPQGFKKVYEIKMNNGDIVECCDEHLWQVKHRRKNKWEVISLKDIMKNFVNQDITNWYLPLTKSCEFTNKNNFYISSYLLGLLLGDGSFRKSIKFTNIDQQLINYVSLEVESKGYRLKPIVSGGIDYLITKGRCGHNNEYINEIKRLALYNLKSNHKFIPDEYKYSSIEQRWQILQGLMDSDGYVDKNGNCSLSTTSIKLANDTKEIVQSLGGIAKISNKISSYNGKQFHSFICRISFNDNTKIFKLSRKVARCKLRTKSNLKMKIQSFVCIGEKLCQCIKVKNEDGLYLTNNFIVTHNTTLCDNVGMHIADVLGVPVLNLDSEMTKKNHWDRLLAYISNVEVDKIRTGKFFQDPILKHKVQEAGQILKTIPYRYESIIGMDINCVIGVVRRWLMKYVGFQESGVANPCVIIYDYLKLASEDALSKNVQEYQALGFQINQLHNFVAKYEIPCLALIQLTRDGITKEDTSIISGSDRQLWACTSFCILKKKSDVEMAEEIGKDKHNRKIIQLAARFAEEPEEGDYLNVNMLGQFARIVEGKMRNNKYNIKKSGELVDDANSIPEEDRQF